MINAPIYKALREYAQSGPLRLHMPGHVGGKGFSIEELRVLGAIDATEIPGLDDLHLPESIIEEARRHMAAAYGAEESFFLVNGATSGIHSLFLTLAQQGKKVLVPRNAHRSFMGGMIISGVWPVYVPYQMDPYTGLVLAVAVEDIDFLLSKYNDIAAIFLTSPSYYGTTVDIRAIARLAAQKGIVLFVDEAHGGHFAFHDEFPETALHAGADAVVNSLHKTLPVLNQGAVLHRAEKFNNQQIFNCYSILSTTSPSYPILASLDYARALMVEKGKSLLANALNLAYEYKPKINGIKGLSCLEKELKAVKGVTGTDPLKVIVSVNELNIDGYTAGSILREKYNIQVELCEKSIILAMFSLFHERSDWEHFYQALQKIASDHYQRAKPRKPINVLPKTQVVLSPREAFLSKKKTVLFTESLGQVSGEMIAVYPPGIPCLLPGELITAEMIEYLQTIKNTQAKVHGLQDSTLKTIQIIEEF